MFSYTAYGLHIQSYLSLPELAEDTAPADVTIQSGKVPHPASPVQLEQCIWATATEAIFFWEVVGTILVRNGQEIIVDAIPDGNPNILRLFLLGSALGTLLHQRGLLVLHGSVVAINGSAIAFLGESGWGKSTTVAALCDQGHQMVADDVLVINFTTAGRPIVFPGFPQVKLWSDAVTSLGGDPQTLERIRPKVDKYVQQYKTNFTLQPIPLKQLYILGMGTELDIEPIELQQAFKELVFHSYAVPFLKTAFSNPEHFRKCAKLINSVAISRLKRQRDLLALTEIVRLIETDVTRLSPQPSL
jgi:HPr Serine kinase C-terminal domain